MSLRTELSSFSISWFGCCKLILLGRVGKTLWKLQPQFDNDGRFKYFDVLRSINAGILDFVKFEIRLTLLDDEDDEEDKQSFSGCFEDGQTTVRIVITDCWSIADGEKIEGCVTVYRDRLKRSKCGTRTRKEMLSFSNLPDGHLKIMNSCEFLADATLKCGTIEIPVHKNVLAARSPFFAAKFKNKMEDNCEAVEITDIKSDVLKYILKFIYSGKVDHVPRELAEDLLIAADKYQLQELKLTCAEELKWDTTVDNVFRNLVLGHLHENNLKSRAKEIVCKYYKFSDLENKEEWMVLEGNYPRLAIEVLKSMVKNAQESK